MKNNWALITNPKELIILWVKGDYYISYKELWKEMFLMYQRYKNSNVDINLHNTYTIIQNKKFNLTRGDLRRIFNGLYYIEKLSRKIIIINDLGMIEKATIIPKEGKMYEEKDKEKIKEMVEGKIYFNINELSHEEKTYMFSSSEIKDFENVINNKLKKYKIDFHNKNFEEKIEILLKKEGVKFFDDLYYYVDSLGYAILEIPKKFNEKEFVNDPKKYIDQWEYIFSPRLLYSKDEYNKVKIRKDRSYILVAEEPLWFYGQDITKTTIFTFPRNKLFFVSTLEERRN